MKRKIRLLLGKMGLDGHDHGVRVIGRALRDAGCEVIYLGLYQTAEKIMNMAVQEGVDFIGLSFASGTHLEETKDLFDLLTEKGLSIPIVVGGIIPVQDVGPLKKLGVSEVFITGAMVNTIGDYVLETFGKEIDD